MKICLTCHRLSRHRAKFCLYCGRSFGGRLCRDSHLSSRQAKCCAECGSAELTHATSYLSLRLPQVILTVFLFLLAARIAVAALPFLASLFTQMFSGAFQFVFGITFIGLVFLFLRVLILAMLVEVAFRMILPKRLPTNLVTLQLTIGALTVAGRLLRKLISRVLGLDNEGLKDRKPKRRREKI